MFDFGKDIIETFHHQIFPPVMNIVELSFVLVHYIRDFVVDLFLNLCVLNLLLRLFFQLILLNINHLLIILVSLLGILEWFIAWNA